MFAHMLYLSLTTLKKKKKILNGEPETGLFILCTDWVKIIVHCKDSKSTSLPSPGSSV